jgi:thiaminase (transcriptional activator TenA)
MVTAAGSVGTGPDPDGFCVGAWAHTASLQRAICEHPFNRALADGSLAQERFAFYLVQDSQYLVRFSRALALTSARSADAETAAFLAGSADRALVVERSLHADYLDRLPRPDVAGGITPVCEAYASFLVATAAVDDYPVACAALLPCFWVYQHVGETIAAGAGPTERHPYGAWIATYADEEFARSVWTLRTIVDREAAGTDEGERTRMLAAFTRASEYEWLFWDSAWREETWPTRRWLPREEPEPSRPSDNPASAPADAQRATTPR